MQSKWDRQSSVRFCFQSIKCTVQLASTGQRRAHKEAHNVNRGGGECGSNIKRGQAQLDGDRGYALNLEKAEFEVVSQVQSPTCFLH